MDIQHIGIIGAGELGSAVGHVLEKSGLQVLYYDIRDDRTTTASIGDVVATCNVLLLCVPSWANEGVAKRIAQHSKPGQLPVVISLSKGVERGFVTMDKVLAQALPAGTVHGLLYGPMLASDISAHHMGSGVLSLADMEYAGVLRDMFAKAYIYLALSANVRGIALSGALKNVYAMAFGVSDGLQLGINARGYISVLALREMKRIVAALGEDAEVAEGIAGLGDLVATGTSEASFNYRVGRSIAEGIADEHVESEGLHTLKELSHAVKLTDYPLAHALDQLVYHYGEPSDFKKLFEL